MALFDRFSKNLFLAIEYQDGRLAVVALQLWANPRVGPKCASLSAMAWRLSAISLSRVARRRETRRGAVSAISA
jgi:hypothetical protein